MQKILKLIEKEMFIVRESIDCVQDIGFPERRHERYDTLLLKDSYNTNINMIIQYDYLLLIRNIIIEESKKINLTSGSATTLAVASLGVGACSEITLMLLSRCLKHKEICDYGYFVNILLHDKNKEMANHQFLFFVPKGLESHIGVQKAFSSYIYKSLEVGTDDFKERISYLPKEILEQIILVDGWRNIVEPLNEKNLFDLLQGCEETNLRHALQLNYIFLNHTFEAIQLGDKKFNSVAKQIIEHTLPYLLLHSGIFQLIWKKCENFSTAIKDLNTWNNHNLQFKPYTRRGYVLDAFAELVTPNDMLNAQQFIKTYEMGVITRDKLAILDVNIDNDVQSKIRKMVP